MLCRLEKRIVVIGEPGRENRIVEISMSLISRVTGYIIMVRMNLVFTEDQTDAFA